MAKNDTNKWNRLASDIETTVIEAYQRLISLPDETIQLRPNPDDWSVKEIVGHLIDSASNNHQRFVRLQVADGLVFPDYSQDSDTWVSIQSYQDAPWEELLALWRHFNLHLARIIRTVKFAFLVNYFMCLTKVHNSVYYNTSFYAHWRIHNGHRNRKT